VERIVFACLGMTYIWCMSVVISTCLVVVVSGTVISAGAATTVYDTDNDFAPEDDTPQLDYKSAYM